MSWLDEFLKWKGEIMVQAGMDAPEFELPDEQGNMVKLSNLRGKIVVLYFYPRADTPGCTKEACSFRDAQPRFDEKNTVVLGISPDTQADQAKFASKYDLSFHLLCDTEHRIAEAYGTWVEKNNYGKQSMGIQRSTFIIGPDGKIAKVFPRVTVDGHSEAVLDVVRQLQCTP